MHCPPENSQVYYVFNSLPDCHSKIRDLESDCLPALLELYKTHRLNTTPLTELVPRYLSALEHVWTLYDFPGTDAEDMSFEKSEFLVIIEKPDEQWWSAQSKDGRVGMVPIPFVKRLARGAAHRVLWETMRDVPGVYPFLQLPVRCSVLLSK